MHLLPAFGSLELKDLSREQVQRLYARKRDQGLSSARVRRIHDVLSAALNKAVLWRLVAHNVCKEVSLPCVDPPAIRPLKFERGKAIPHQPREDAAIRECYGTCRRVDSAPRHGRVRLV